MIGGGIQRKMGKRSNFLEGRYRNLTSAVFNRTDFTTNGLIISLGIAF